MHLRRSRGRTAKACSQCHTRKQKCEGSTPCQNCVSRNVTHLCTPPGSRSATQTSSYTRTASSTRPRVRRRRIIPEQHTVAPPDLVGVHQQPTITVADDEDESGENQRVEDGLYENTNEPTHNKEQKSLQIGQLWKSRGAPAFFGSSYFGPQVAAALIDSQAPYVQPGANTSRRSMNARPFRDEAGPFSQLWDLLGLLPRQKSTVDRLVDKFLTHVSWNMDAVHPSSFRREYDRFWSRKAGYDDVTTVDIRWLALLFMILAIGAYLDCPRGAAPETQREYEESSLSFFWASRKAIVIAPSFYGESSDLVRAGILVTRYCLFAQRITESWLTVGFAARLAIAQGFHIDGRHWRLPRRVVETRRRLWCHLYLLDRMTALALGRPYCILDTQSLTCVPENVFLDDLTDDEALTVDVEPIDTSPTPAVLAVFSHGLAKIIGQIQEQTFGIRAASYRQVMQLDAQLVAWRDSLPAYLAFENPNLSLDSTCSYLAWHRLYIRTAFYFARITLHRPYIWRSSITDQHAFSRDVCFASACADLKTRLGHDDNSEPAEHYTWCLGAPQLFNSAIVLGVLAIQEQSRGTRDVDAVVNDLQSYCDKQKHEIWVNDFRLAEIKVVEMCIERLKRPCNTRQALNPIRMGNSEAALTGVGRRRGREAHHQNSSQQGNAEPSRAISAHNARVSLSGQDFTQIQPHQSLAVGLETDNALWPSGSLIESGLRHSPQISETFTFPGPTDLATWQDMIDIIGTHEFDMSHMTGFS
ncbi:fungal-specific transcription factor domain-containing protein [Talaromyces proteolyticus]|uniref:Fungal-specific transcription factor domain-containing protein n=1 Tax=Talaromyces proteolyticus TaxID=1131652 RepID=A0AAD4KRV0_9EURO|nr:fungal-specific transcription factor domain-containing protein [Talaromyces proteolyticus]KAH8697453.1 fungal-specific transcription factor domain-containing protein [Talaromyces proteolyticus]